MNLDNKKENITCIVTENISNDVNANKIHNLEIENMLDDFKKKYMNTDQDAYCPVSIINDDIDYNDNYGNEDMYTATIIEYETNYTVNQLKQIMEYYKITCRKLRKEEMVLIISEFEMDPNNIELVSKRKELWDNILELKNDPFFKKYILF